MKKLCAVFLFSILVVTIAALPVFAIENKAIDAYDFSLSSAVDNKTLDSAMALELLLGYSLSDVEYDYINRHTGFSIKYNDGITTALIVCEHNPATNVLTVSAKEYVYKGKNGATVCWIPKSATFGQTKVDLNSDGEFYSGVFGNANEDDSAVVVVDYEFSFTVSKDAVNNLLNLAYNDAVSFADTIAEKEREYQSLKYQYDNDLASYEDYLERLSEYESDMSAYTAYLLEKRFTRIPCASITSIFLQWKNIIRQRKLTIIIRQSLKNTIPPMHSTETISPCLMIILKRTRNTTNI